MNQFPFKFNENLFNFLEQIVIENFRFKWAIFVNLSPMEYFTSYHPIAFSLSKKVIVFKIDHSLLINLLCPVPAFIYKESKGHPDKPSPSMELCIKR